MRRTERIGGPTHVLVYDSGFEGRDGSCAELFEGFIEADNQQGLILGWGVRCERPEGFLLA